MTAYTEVAAGDDILAATIDDILRATLNKPRGRIRQTTTQTGIVNSTNTALTFTTEDIDSHGYHSTSSNTSRVTPLLAGDYRVTGSLSLGGNTDYTQVQVFLALNGTALAPACRITPGATSQTLVIGTTAIISCNGSTDYFEVWYQATRSGAGTTSTAVSAQFASALEWEYIGPTQ